MTKRPIVIFAIFWTIGIACALMKWWVVLALAGLTAVIYLAMQWPRDKRYVVALIALVLSVGWSTLYDQFQQSGITLDHVDDLEPHMVTVIGRIASPLKIDGDRASFEFHAEQTIFHQQSKAYEGKETFQVFITLQSEEEWLEAKKLSHGMKISLVGQLERPSVATNFGAFDYRQHLYWKGIHWIVRVDRLAAINVDSFLTEQRSFSFATLGLKVQRVVDRFRTNWGEQLDELFPAEQSGWLKSMTIGIRDDLDPDTFTQFSMIGLSHILAISGLHVGIFIAVLLGLLRLFRLSKETSLMIVICVIPFYIVATGAAPSVVRAGMMAMLGLYALKRGWLKDGLNLVCATGVIMLLFHPYYLWQISFQLSFIVTIGLIVFVPLWNRLFPLRPTWLQSSIAVTFVAQFISFPVTAYYFSHLSLLSWLANLVLVPFMSMIIFPLAMAAVLVSWVHGPLGGFLAQLIIPLNEWITSAIAYLNQWQAIQLLWRAPSLAWILLYYVLCYVLFTQLVRFKLASTAAAPPLDRKGLFGLKFNKWTVPLPRVQLWSGVLSGVLLVMLIIYGYTPDMWQRHGEVQFIDVGQGDAILLQTPMNKTVLIDTGGRVNIFEEQEELWRSRQDPFEVGKDVVVPLLKKRGIQQLDYVVLTHHDYDHVGGLLAVLDHIPVKNVIFNGTVRERDFLRERIHRINEKNIPLFAAKAGETLRLDRYTEMVVLHPEQPPEQTIISTDEQNDHSVVFWLKMHDSTFLFTGDIHEAGERNILQFLATNDVDQVEVPVDVLKVAHHGSRTSSSPEWLAYWQPGATVISVGRYNFYGHPSDTVLERLEYFDSHIYRTDLHGEVQFRVYSSKLEARTMLD